MLYEIEGIALPFVWDLGTLQCRREEEFDRIKLRMSKWKLLAKCPNYEGRV